MFVVAAISQVLISCTEENVESDTSVSQTPESTVVTTKVETLPDTNVHIHAFRGWKTIKKSTCDEEGVKTRQCPCGEKEERSIPKLEHFGVSTSYLAPTCTSEGLTAGLKCIYCGITLNGRRPIQKRPHIIAVDPAVAATCTATGKTEGKHCSVCNEVFVEQKTIPMKVHTETIDKAVEPTCTSTGKSAGKHCSVCGKVLVAQKELPLKSHTEADDPASESTCTVAGKTAGKHCSVCGKVLVAQKDLPLKSHTEVDDPASESTCTVAGKTAGKHCSVCGKVLVAQNELPLKKHVIVTDPASEATCGVEGVTKGEHCSVCGTILVPQKTIEKIGYHIDRNKDKKCDICNIELKLSYRVNADGQSCTIIGAGTCILETVIIPRTIDGYKVTEISDCDNDNIKAIVIPNTVWRVGLGPISNYTNKVYYEGTVEQWSAVSLSDYISGHGMVVGITGFTMMPKYFYSEKRPAVGGLYWHYVNGKVTEW